MSKQMLLIKGYGLKSVPTSKNILKSDKRFGYYY